MSDDTDHRAVMAAAILNAIIDSSRAHDGTVTVNSSDARQALSTAMATIMEADPRLVTAKQMRELTETLGRDVLIQMKAMRGHFERTGTRPWDATRATRQ